MYSKIIIIKMKSGLGIIVEGYNINHLQCADDTLLVAKYANYLQKPL